MDRRDKLLLNANDLAEQAHASSVVQSDAMLSRAGLGTASRCVQNQMPVLPTPAFLLGRKAALPQGLVGRCCVSRKLHWESHSH